MNKEKFIVVKLKESEINIINRINKSYSKKNSKYYNLTDDDKKIISELDKNKEYNLVYILFDEKFKSKKIYIGKGTINEQNNIKYHIEYEVISELVIKNFILNLGINLELDFKLNSYISIETSAESLKNLEFSVKKLYSVERRKYSEQNYKTLDYENLYDTLSQKNEHCKRAIDFIKPKRSCRGEFQRDRERIIHTKSFRRLVDKAQIFTSSKGDHYRTRMTHTLEVTQISRGISIELNLNNELTEAIALAHDIGHTPFGHQGERTINDILKNNIQIIPNCEFLNMGGFKHNFQGIRILDYLEEKYLDFEGLDLSYQVLEGVLKHTRFNCKNDYFNIDEFLINGDKEYLFLQFENATTLEGQIVSIADEIAQRGHDLDDALASRHISIDGLIESCGIKKMKSIYNIFLELRKEIKQIEEKNRVFIEKNDIARSRIVSEIITFFINDVVEHSKKLMREFNTNNKFYIEHHRINKRLIDFSDNGKFILSYLEGLINKKVINSFDVSRFDRKSEYIIERLFKEYYNNIKILPDRTLKRIYREIRKISGNVIDFRNGDTKLVREEVYKICNQSLSEMDIEYINKRKIVVRNISDHIAGMTDQYALDEYKRIFDI